MKKILLVFCIGFVCSRSLAQPGSLDFTFGSGGKVTTEFISGDNYARSMAIQPDGKIIVVGGVESIFWDFKDYIAVARYNSDGSLDHTFSSDGMIITVIGSEDDEAFYVGVQSDGKIIVGGFSYNDSTGKDFLIIRYNSDGSLDESFGIDGIVLDSAGDIINAIVIQQDGKIIAGGIKGGVGSNSSGVLIRYNADGTIDSTFGEDGIVTVDFYSDHSGISSLVLQSDGKVVAAGYAYIGNYDFAVARYNSDGTLDSSFNNVGKVITGIGSGNDNAESVVLQSDGKILVGGFSDVPAKIAMVRYKSNGNLDSSFSADGIVTSSFSSGDSYFSQLTLQADQKIVAVGSTDATWNHTSFGLARFNDNGTLDSSFGIDGNVITTFGTGECGTSSVAIQFDGKIIVAGSTDIGGALNFAIARYLSGLEVGIIDITSPQVSLHIYPNPASSVIQLHLPSSPTTLSIFDLLGEKVKEQKVATQEVTMEVSELPAGMYVVKTEKEMVGKFVKE